MRIFILPTHFGPSAPALHQTHMQANFGGGMGNEINKPKQERIKTNAPTLRGAKGRGIQILSSQNYLEPCFGPSHTWVHLTGNCSEW